MTNKRNEPAKISIDGETGGAGLLILMLMACAFILGLIVGTLIWMPH